MLRSTLTRGLGLVVAATVVGGGALLMAAPASAEEIGTVSFSPANGTNNTLINISTTGPCDQGTNILVKATGNGFPVGGYTVVGNTATSIYPTNETGGYVIPLSGSFQQFADAQNPPATLSGPYVVTVQCRNAISGAFGTFSGTITFNSATAYTSGPVVTATDTVLEATPASGASTATSVTLTATVSPSAAAGTVQFQDGSTNIGSPVVVTDGVATTTTTFATAGTKNLSAVFTPTDPATYGSSTGTLSYTVTQAVVATTTGLSANPLTGGAAYTPVALTATVDPVAAVGSVQFLEGAAILGTVPVASGSGVLNYSGFAEGSHTVTAKFIPADPAAFATSTSSAVTITTAAPTGPEPDPQTVTVNVPAGSLLINTPYTPDNPLDLGVMVLNANGTLFSASASFGTTATPIQVTDTRAGNQAWTASALAGNFSNAGGDQINAQNLGLTNLQYVLTPGNALTASNVAVYDNVAANGVAVSDTGSLGLGGSTPHKFADTANGTGTIGFTGTMTLNAPTSTAAGQYTATVVFTIG